MPGRRYSFEVNRVSTAPPPVLFRLESDGSLWADWAKPLIWQSRWARRGDDGRVGAVREVGLWPVLLRERTVEYESDRRHVYTFDGSGPVRDYRAEVTFTPNAAGGTDLRWTGSFEPRIPGTGELAKFALRSVIGFLASRLAKAGGTAH
ncbi:SRPBCC family protein [Amycolatopsis benzoatilytica]|uniref:SRPBCC family protein n=1 Tax=Amycolatopsis benzoatilytica TaxID=346045 RepID=UPI00035EBC82|nr:SRPBCC family protein [Amycolatopsis benzoatilytica]